MKSIKRTIFLHFKLINSSSRNYKENYPTQSTSKRRTNKKMRNNRRKAVPRSSALRAKTPHKNSPRKQIRKLLATRTNMASTRATARSATTSAAPQWRLPSTKSTRCPLTWWICSAIFDHYFYLHKLSLLKLSDSLLKPIPHQLHLSPVRLFEEFEDSGVAELPIDASFRILVLIDGVSKSTDGLFRGCYFWDDPELGFLGLVEDAIFFIEVYDLWLFLVVIFVLDACLWNSHIAFSFTLQQSTVVSSLHFLALRASHTWLSVFISDAIIQSFWIDYTVGLQVASVIIIDRINTFGSVNDVDRFHFVDLLHKIGVKIWIGWLL